MEKTTGLCKENEQQHIENQNRLLEFKTKVRDDFFDTFIGTTETGYFFWKKNGIPAGNWAGDILSFIWNKLDEYDKLITWKQDDLQ